MQKQQSFVNDELNQAFIDGDLNKTVSVTGGQGYHSSNSEQKMNVSKEGSNNSLNNFLEDIGEDPEQCNSNILEGSLAFEMEKESKVIPSESKMFPNQSKMFPNQSKVVINETKYAKQYQDQDDQDDLKELYNEIYMKKKKEDTAEHHKKKEELKNSGTISQKSKK